jgi:DNA-binding LytR/AlgR family response regulator
MSESKIYKYVVRVNHESKTYLKYNEELICFDVTEILFIENLNEQIKLYIENRNFTVEISIDLIILRLPKSFLRIHENYIVNKAKLSIRDDEFLYINNNKIPYKVNLQCLNY